LIDDAAARILFEEIISKHDDFIVLNLTQLPEVAAQGLAKLTGDGVTLDLDRLSEMSEAVATGLAKNKGADINLDKTQLVETYGKSHGWKFAYCATAER
jgi:hypothetical protein